jgi:hypothetical protein
VSPKVTTVAVPTLTAASGAALDSATFTISKTTAGKYNAGELIVSHDGAIVATASLNAILQASSATGTLTISGLPGGSASGLFADALYYVSVRTWNTSTVTTVLPNREIYPNPLDLSTGTLTNYSLTID